MSARAGTLLVITVAVAIVLAVLLQREGREPAPAPEPASVVPAYPGASGPVFPVEPPQYDEGGLEGILPPARPFGPPANLHEVQLLRADPNAGA